MRFLKNPFLLIAFFIYKMPFCIHQIMAWTVALIWFDLLRIRRKVAVDNILRVFPEKPQIQARRMARQSLYHIGLTMIEFFFMPFFKEEDFRQIVEVEGEEKLKQTLKKNKGGLLLGVHISNGDLAMAALASWGYPIHVISKIFKHKWLNRIWFDSRRSRGIEFIPSRRSSYQVLKALKKNKLVVFPLDQYTGPPNGILTHFFGQTTGTAVGLALFAQRSGAPVLPAHIYRKGYGKYKLVIGPPILFEKRGSGKDTLHFMTQKYNFHLEQIIRKHPQQWMWIHRRWKVGFPGQKETDSTNPISINHPNYPKDQL